MNYTNLTFAQLGAEARINEERLRVVAKVLQTRLSAPNDVMLGEEIRACAEALMMIRAHAVLLEPK